MKNFRIEAIVIAMGLVILGFFVRSGLYVFSDKDRVVTVKGLAEMEVPANKVTWPILFKDAGNDLAALYQKTNATNQEIVSFLKQNGLTDAEISVNPPELFDNTTERYAQQNVKFRYNISSVITVTSTKVDLVRKLIQKQGDLIAKGIVVGSEDYRYQTSYEFTGLNAVKPKMIEEATRNAREAALKFAKDSESELGKIKSALQGQFSITNRDSNTPYIQKIRVVTTVVYFLKN